MRWTHSLLTVLISALWLIGSPAAQAQDLLDVDEAFKLQPAEVDNGQITVRWEIAQDYKLYKDKLSVSSESVALGTPQYAPAKLTDDPLFGKTEIYARSASVTLPYTANSATQATLVVKYQGCADLIGVCYPPQTRELNVTLPATTAATAATASSAPAAGFDSLQALNKLLSANNPEPELLEADQAFAFSSDVQNGQLIAQWQIAEDYHLYQDKIKVKLLEGQADIGALQLPQAIEIDDPLFGKTRVYHGQLHAPLVLSNVGERAVIEFEYQGCSASAGVCYPPARKTVEVRGDQLSAAPADSASMNGAQLATASVQPGDALSETDRIADTLKNSSVWIVILTFLLFGLLLALTPCVFPMIPILSSIIVGQGDQLTTRRAFVMSLVYVLAMSVTYTVAGVLAGLFGENLQAAFQNPWIIGTFAIVFILLAFSMFGFYELQLPSRLQTKLTNLSNKQQGGTLTGVAIMGFLSALIVGPCVAPPLAGALIYIGQTGDALLGGIALFAMSMGMGLPLLLLGTSAGKLLPRAGGWMDAVKAVFGVMLIGVAIWMAERIMPAELTLLAWALLFIVSAVYMGAFDSTADKSGWFKLFKGLGLALALYGSLILVGLLGGSQSVLQPLKVFQSGGGSVSGAPVSDKLAFTTIKSVADLEAELAKGQPVMFDFYADWCVTCKEMEALTFTSPKVHQALAGVTLLKADVTANDALDKALMKHFGIIGPPAILFFNAQGEEQKAQRVIGFKNADDFTTLIEQALH
jgi:thiol:disulfide interchange protein DsbD